MTMTGLVLTIHPRSGGSSRLGGLGGVTHPDQGQVIVVLRLVFQAQRVVEREIRKERAVMSEAKIYKADRLSVRKGR